MGLLYFASNSSINMTVCAGKQIVAMAQLFENKTLKTKLCCNFCNYCFCE